MDETYETPAIEERTEVTEPLSLITSKSGSTNLVTPTWRRPDAD